MTLTVVQDGPPPGTRHHVPIPGHQRGLRVGEGAQTYLLGRSGLVTVNGQLYAPLLGIQPSDVLQGGYAFLDPTDAGATYHPGADLNTPGGCDTDLGAPIVAMLGGVVRAVLVWDGYSSGEGNHLWYEVDDPLAPGPTWVHHDHLDRISVTVGQRVAAGEVIAACGKSGNWSCAHAHTEWLPGAPPDGFWQWPYGWSKSRVQAAYYSPASWWQAASARAQGASPEVASMILSGAQSAAVQAVVWGQFWNPDMADAGIPASWRAEWHAGRWRGEPISGEEPIPEDPAEGKPAGNWQRFAYGAAVWLPGQEVSWNG